SLLELRRFQLLLRKHLDSSTFGESGSGRGNQEEIAPACSGYGGVRQSTTQLTKEDLRRGVVNIADHRNVFRSNGNLCIQFHVVLPAWSTMHAQVEGWFSKCLHDFGNGDGAAIGPFLKILEHCKTARAQLVDAAYEHSTEKLGFAFEMVMRKRELDARL